jgi:tetratricopeptide (TPR) repeat protein
VGIPTVYLNQSAELDWLIALEFGRVDDGQPPENWRGVSEQLGFLHDGPDGPVCGFKIKEFSHFDPEEPGLEQVWGEPMFNAPVLGLSGASVGEIVLAIRALFGNRNTINRELFNRAANSRGKQALGMWLACLQAGDSMAHFGLGYTLYELGRHSEAYRHLRHYTEISPCGSWNWCWFGKAAAEVGEIDEARAAFLRALELTAAGAEETEAAELLEELEAGRL